MRDTRSNMTRLFTLLLLASLFYLSQADCYTDQRTWRIALLYPPTVDGQRVINSVQLAVSQTTQSTHALYTPNDTFVFTSNTDAFSDSCSISAASATSAGISIAVQSSVVSANIVIGGSCSEVDLSLAPQITKPIISYRAYDPRLSSIGTYSYFMRSNILPTTEAQSVYALLSFHDLYSVGVMCTDDYTTFCTSFASVASQYKIDANIQSQFPRSYNASSDAVTSARVASTLETFRSKNIRVLILYLYYDTAINVFQAMYANNMYGSNYYFIIAPDLQTSVLFTNQISKTVVSGALMITPVASVPGFLPLQFASEYGAVNNKDAPGVLGSYAYDSVQMLVAATRLMRSNCENVTDSATLNKYLRLVSFNGVTGPFSIQSGGNDRTGFDLYMVINVVDTSFVTVGRIQSGTVFINKAVVFPGAQSTPIKQWRIGLMYSNSSSAPSDVVVPVALAYAVSQVNLVTNVDSPLYAAKGRETAVVLASHVAVDDCGQTSGQATAGLQNILKFRNPMAIIGPSCLAVLSDSTFMTLMTSSAVPFIVFGAKSFQFPSVAKLPNVVRISLPTSLESQVLASCMVYFGWIRSSVLYTSDVQGSALFALYPTQATNLGIRSPQTMEIADNTNLTHIDAFFKAQSTTGTSASIVLLGSSSNRTEDVLTSLMNSAVADKQQLVGGGYFGKALSLLTDPDLTDAATGMLFSDTSFNNAVGSTVYNLTTAFSSAYPSYTTLDYLPYIYDGLLTALQTMNKIKAFQGNPYSVSTFATALHSVNLVGVLGNINFTATSSDRLPASGIIRIRSYRGPSQYDLVGTNDAVGNFVLTSRPQVWLNGTNVTVQSCTRGSVGVLSGARFTCLPCAVGRYALTSATTCSNCSSSRLCPLGTWAANGFDPSVNFNQPNVTRFPVTPGDWLSVSEVMAFDLMYLYYFLGIAVGMVLVFAAVVQIFKEKAENFLMKFDIFVTDHPIDEGQYLIVRSTAVGGYCSIIWAALSALTLSYFVTRYRINRYVISSQQNLGTTTLINPTPLSFNLTYISIDNAPECNAICTRGTPFTQQNGISGTLKCDMNTVTTMCTVSWLVDPSYQQLPSSFDFVMGLRNAHVHGVHISVSGATFVSKQYGFNTTIQADPGHVLFGYNGSTIINVDLQPYTFTGASDIDPSQAPMYAGGYLAIPNQMIRGPQQNAANWNDATNFQNNAGAYVTIRFNRLNAVTAFYFDISQTITSLFAQCVSLGMAMVLYFTRSVMKMIEGSRKFAEDLKAAALKSDEQWELEQGEKDRQFLAKVNAKSLEQVVVESKEVFDKADVTKQELLKRIKTMSSAELPLTESEKKQKEQEAQQKVQESEEVVLDGGGGKKPEAKAVQNQPEQNSNTSDTDRTIYSSKFPWKLVVNELLTHCQAKDLVQAITQTAERDETSMKSLAECFAPYLHQRAMELKQEMPQAKAGTKLRK